MTDYIQPGYALLLVPIAFALTGATLARNRGRNIVGWAVLCAIFPIFLLVVYFERPLREVRGGFRRCASCGEFIISQASVCKYCNAEQPTSAHDTDHSLTK